VLSAAAPMSLRQCLENIVDIRAAPTPKMLRSLAEFCSNPAERALLLGWAADKTLYRHEIFDSPRHLVDLLAACPSLRLSAERLLELLPSLHPRYYSISSSAMVCI